MCDKDAEGYDKGLVIVVDGLNFDEHQMMMSLITRCLMTIKMMFLMIHRPWTYR